MPLLFNLGQHRAMVAVQTSLLEGERLFAFLDDIYVVCAPSRVGEVYLLLQRHLLEQTGIQVHQGKTGGLKPPVADVLTARARENHPEDVVWRRDPTLDVSRQGLNQKGEEQALSFERIPHVVDVQIAWLLLTFCAATRANYWLRTVPPELTTENAKVHDNRVLQCLCDVLQIRNGLPGRFVATHPGRSWRWEQRTGPGCCFLGRELFA